MPGESAEETVLPAQPSLSSKTRGGGRGQGLCAQLIRRRLDLTNPAILFAVLSSSRQIG
jgi:hypothetical protein